MILYNIFRNRKNKLPAKKAQTPDELVWGYFGHMERNKICFSEFKTKEDWLLMCRYFGIKGKVENHGVDASDWSAGNIYICLKDYIGENKILAIERLMGMFDVVSEVTLVGRIGKQYIQKPRCKKSIGETFSIDEANQRCH